MNILDTYKNKKIVIWGYGIFGQSMVNFLLKNNISAHNICVVDRRELPELAEKGIKAVTQDPAAPFLNNSDIIIPSPGIPIGVHYQNLYYKMHHELDIFFSIWHAMNPKEPLIAITGTVGKTSTTKLLSDILVLKGKKVACGGNIGTPTAELLTANLPTQCTILETSSAQLAFTTLFRPTIAIITNISPNHLDWHGSMESYKKAKWNIASQQQKTDHLIAPTSIIEQQASTHELPTSTIHGFIEEEVSTHQDLLPYCKNLYYRIDSTIWLKEQGKNTPQYIADLSTLPSITYPQNWMVIAATLRILNISIDTLANTLSNLTIPPHRLEKITTSSRIDIDIYNDSKSTTIASTMAAIKILHERPVRLILGGHGKGVDRTTLIKQLPEHIVKIYCFGIEADSLFHACIKEKRAAAKFATLSDLVTTCINESQPGDQILFSPAGTSWDLFRDYQERGNLFKKLVEDLVN